jgi:hypothetical protein
MTKASEFAKLAVELLNLPDRYGRKFVNAEGEPIENVVSIDLESKTLTQRVSASSALVTAYWGCAIVTCWHQPTTYVIYWNEDDNT